MQETPIKQETLKFTGAGETIEISSSQSEEEEVPAH